MPKDGFQSITLPDDIIARIDSLIDESDRSMNSRPDIISLAISCFVEQKKDKKNDQ